MKSMIKRSILKIAERSTLVTSMAAFITHNVSGQTSLKDTYGYLRERFIQNGRNHPIDDSAREKLVAQFELIDREVPIGSTPTDGLFLAEMMLNLQCDGDIVECGCYAGGSSAKLSLLGNLINRKLIIFDSFEGLPSVEQYFLRDYHCRRSDAWVTDWSQGRYAARIDQVRSNIEQYGNLSVCSLVKGWFSETLAPDNLPDQAAFAFTDVDLASSARQCFIALWPILSDRGVYVTHDTAYIKVLQELYNPELWQKRFNSTPPHPIWCGIWTLQ